MEDQWCKYIIIHFQSLEDDFSCSWEHGQFVCTYVYVYASLSVPAFEPFGQADQILSYRYSCRDLRHSEFLHIFLKYTAE